jgi:hypothetical protein
LGGFFLLMRRRRRGSSAFVLGDEGLDITRLHLQSRPAVSRLADILS